MTPRPEVTRYVRNQSSRSGAKPQLIVLHSTESHNRPGIVDLQGLASWFDNPSAQASSHVANDAEGNDARFVPDDRKAWTQAGFNPVSLSIEQIGFAVQTSWPDAQVRNTAEWIAFWNQLYGIPLQRAVVRGSTVIRPGVISHSELGSIGGGHHDPGPSYPVDRVLALAKTLAPAVVTESQRRRRLRNARASLKSVLALRAKLRQERLELEAQYGASQKRFEALRARIKRLAK